MYEVIFLLILAFIWIIVASIYDFRKRIVFDWLNFSLITFALGFRFFYSLFHDNFTFFYQGLIGLGIFFILGTSLYYGRMFAGGDAKLMIALGTILPFSENLIVNIKIFLLFFLLFLFAGAVYGLSWSIYLTISKKKEVWDEMKKQFNQLRPIINALMAAALLVMVLGMYDSFLFYIGIMVFLLPYLYIYSKAIDEVCMVKTVKVKDLEEGDWLYHDLKIGSKTIKADWGGLTKNQIKEIKRKYKSIKIRQGIPFVPVFLIGFLLLVYVWFVNPGLLRILPWF